MYLARHFYYLLLLAQLLLSLHQWIPHCHEPNQNLNNNSFWALLQNVLATDLGESHLENISTQNNDNQPKLLATATQPNLDKNINPNSFAFIAGFILYCFCIAIYASLRFIKCALIAFVPHWQLDSIIFRLRSPRAPPLWL